MDKEALRIVQISDIHLFAEESKSLLGVKTQESFKAVVEHLKHSPKQPDLILLTGDLSQDGSEASYLKIAEAFNAFPVPIYYVPGNHDHPESMKNVFPRNNISADKNILLNHWQLILLDSQKPNAVEGFLDQTQLTYLQHCLQSHPHHHAIVVFHHQPLLVGSHWLDKLGLTNKEEFLQTIAPFSNMHTVLFGHVHQEYAGRKNNVNYYSAPSSCIQFKGQCDEFSLEPLAQGYRWIDLYNDGRLETGIDRIDKYVGEFDVGAKGY